MRILLPLPAILYYIVARCMPYTNKKKSSSSRGVHPNPIIAIVSWDNKYKIVY